MFSSFLVSWFEKSHGQNATVSNGSGIGVGQAVEPNRVVEDDAILPTKPTRKPGRFFLPSQPVSVYHQQMSGEGPSRHTLDAVSRPENADNIDRLTSVADAVNGNESYAFDGVGNRTSSHLSNTYTHQPFNRLTATETGSYSHDANGNSVSKVEGSKRWTYTWDHENRLTQAWDRKTRVRYNYDALGRRVERNLGFGRERTKFTYDGEDVLLDEANGTRTKYLNGPGIDNKLRSKTGGTANFFLADHLGSTNALTDSNGAITASQSYDAFGNATNASFQSRYQFTGREFDSFTGLQFSRARFYDPQLGRFISEDPIGFAGGDVNLYGYVWNDPLHFVDPQGRNGWRNWVAWANERKWQAEQAMLESLEGPIYFAVGFGDSASLGLTTYFRRWQGIENVNWNCSVSYQAGGWAALAATTATGGVGLYRGGLSLATRASGSRVFWSGDPSAMKAAADFARANGGSTLEMTLGGRGMTAANPWLPRWASNPLWRDLSASFARGTRGTADAFLYSGGVRPTSIWLRTEMPILLRNGVQITLHTVP